MINLELDSPVPSGYISLQWQHRVVPFLISLIPANF